MRSIAEHFMLIYVVSESYKTKAQLAQLAEDVSIEIAEHNPDLNISKLKFLDNSEILTDGSLLFEI